MARANGDGEERKPRESAQCEGEDGEAAGCASAVDGGEGREGGRDGGEEVED